MKPNLYKFLRLFLIASVFWVLAFLLFITIRYNGLESELKIYTDEELGLPIRAFYEYAVLLGLTTGVFYTFVEFVFDKLSKRLILGLSVVLKSVIYFVLIIIVLSSISVLIEEEIDIDLSNEKGWWRTDPFFWNTVIYFLVTSIVFSLVRIANGRFGRGNFVKILMGKYKRPKEEERVLMFLDLKDSTKIAEKLGHRQYSEFIQDCLADLNNILTRFEAEVYQYVGDEAVIHWPVKKGFKNNNCIHLFFQFQKRLEQKENYYLKTYGFNPKFKAGIHYGVLMVAEVGTVKKDLAFHGDVINTASRIQSLCNQYQKQLLVSESVLEKLSISPTHYELLSEDVELRGKAKRLKIYAINQR